MSLRLPVHLSLAYMLSITSVTGCSSDDTKPKTTPPEVETCEAGTLDCPCGPDGTCGSSPEGQPLTCGAENVCVLNICTQGSLGCQCGTDDACSDGTSCREGLCTPETGYLVVVDNSDARACDVLFTVNGQPVSSVEFTETALGSEFARGNKLGVSFMRRLDAPFGTVAPAAIHFAGPDAAAANALTISSAQCYDSDGKAIAETQVSLN